jgi:hypothetical protein
LHVSTGVNELAGKMEVGKLESAAVRGQIGALGKVAIISVHTEVES